MRLGYFAMPMHPSNRPWQATLEEDRQAVILADRLGFHDAFIGEHLTDRYENITNSMVFLASLIHDTERINWVPAQPTSPRCIPVWWRPTRPCSTT